MLVCALVTRLALPALTCRRCHRTAACRAYLLRTGHFLNLLTFRQSIPTN
jgi:hypothetical protein